MCIRDRINRSKALQAPRKAAFDISWAPLKAGFHRRSANGRDSPAKSLSQDPYGAGFPAGQDKLEDLSHCFGIGTNPRTSWGCWPLPRGKACVPRYGVIIETQWSHGKEVFQVIETTVTVWQEDLSFQATQFTPSRHVRQRSWAKRTRRHQDRLLEWPEDVRPILSNRRLRMNVE